MNSKKGIQMTRVGNLVRNNRVHMNRVQMSGKVPQ